MKLIVYTQISIKGSYKLIVWFWWGMVKHSQNSQNSKFAIFKDEVDFLHGDKHQSFLKVYFNLFGIKVSYKVDIIIINGHDQAFSNYSK